jgi:hypothetical protein
VHTESEPHFFILEKKETWVLKINTPFLRSRVLGFRESKHQNRFYFENKLKIIYKNIPTSHYIFVCVLDRLGHRPTCGS